MEKNSISSYEKKCSDLDQHIVKSKPPYKVRDFLNPLHLIKGFVEDKGNLIHFVCIE